MKDVEAWNYDIDNDETQPICSKLLPVICEHFRVIDDCGFEGCSKYGHTWNTWAGQDGCDSMGELGYSPYYEGDQKE